MRLQDLVTATHCKPRHAPSCCAESAVPLLCVILTKPRQDVVFAMQGTLDALQQIAKAEGSAGLLRGFWPTVWANAPFSAVYYMLYTDLKKRLQKVQLCYL